MSDEKPQQSASKAFDLLAPAASFARNKRIALNDPALVDRFLADARPQLETALGDKILVHGSRTERLFEATVLTLGRYRMLKPGISGGSMARQSCARRIFGWCWKMARSGWSRSRMSAARSRSSSAPR